MGVAVAAAHQGVEPEEDLGGLEGLGHVVVGAGGEAGGLVGPAGAGGEHQHRQLEAVLAPLGEPAAAVAVGQAQVEDHRVVGLGAHQEVRLAAAGGVLEQQAGIPERLAQRLGQRRVVLHQQYLHGASLRRMASILTPSMPISSPLSASNSNSTFCPWGPSISIS